MIENDFPICELRQASFFSSKFVLTFPAVDCSSYKFERRRKILSVSKDNELLIRTDGFSCLDLSGVRYLNKNMMLTNLVSEEGSIELDWSPESWTSKAVNNRCDATFHGNRFEVLNQVAFPFWYLTRINVRPTSAEFDSTKMLACACFFWCFFENQRIQTA